jgi:hypothetical protein
MQQAANDAASKILAENKEPAISVQQTEEIMNMARSFHKRAVEKLKK